MSTTSRCPACTTPASCAARMARRRSNRSISSPRSNSPASPRCSSAKIPEKRGAGALRLFPARPARAASSYPGDRSRLLRRPSRRGGGGNRSLYRARRGGADRSRLRAAARGHRSRKGARARRACGASANGPTTRPSTYHQDGGDVDKAFAEADVIVKQRITSQRLIPAAMETRGVVAEWRRAIAHSRCIPPPRFRTWCARWWRRCSGPEENRLRVDHARSGRRIRQQAERLRRRGAHGFIAMKIGKPVKWIECRRENFQCTIHGRGHVDYLRSRGQKRRHDARHQAEADPRSGRISSVADARHSHAFRADDARPLQLPEHFAPISSACSPTPCPPTLIAARGVRKPRTASNAWWISWPPN